MTVARKNSSLTGRKLKQNSHLPPPIGLREKEGEEGERDPEKHNNTNYDNNNRSMIHYNNNNSMHGHQVGPQQKTVHNHNPWKPAIHNHDPWKPKLMFKCYSSLNVWIFLFNQMVIQIFI